MKILLCASEAAPFAKTGGLADVIGALPKALYQKKQDVCVVLPYYKKIKEKNIAYYQGYAYVDIAGRLEYAGVFHTIVDGVNFYFIDNDRYFNRDNLYGYGDDGERFAFFDFAVLEMLRVINFYPDVIHLNDWQTGLIPYILKNNYREHEEYRNIKTIFSIHNIQYQGIFPKNIMDILYLPYSSSLEFDDNINFMKTAIVESNIINTVSKTYKDETLTDYYGYRLNNILGSRYDDYYGILNGIDTSFFDPGKDKHIYKNYTIKNYIEGKKENKSRLLDDVDLTNDDSILFGLVSRLVDQKGIDLLRPILEEVLNETNAKFILMGTGDKVYEDFFFHLEYHYPKRVKAYVGYNEAFANKVYAASDVFLMPSKFEPCGLGQMIAMRYGTLPLVRETGGLKDSVIPYNKYTNEGTGFSFNNYNAHSLKDVMMIAIETYKDKDAFNTLIKNAMSQDFSWKQSANSYIELYKKLRKMED